MAEEYQIVSSNPVTQGFYEHCRDEGNSHRMAEMLAFQQAPRCNTDREFFEGVGTLAKQFEGDEKVLDQITRNSMKHGHKPNANDMYVSALAKFPGDPKAFVPASGGRGHVQEVCEQRGWACSGSVNVKSREAESAPKKVALGEDIVRSKIRQMVRNNPDNARKSYRELRESVIDKHGPKK